MGIDGFGGPGCPERSISRQGDGSGEVPHQPSGKVVKAASCGDADGLPVGSIPVLSSSTLATDPAATLSPEPVCSDETEEIEETALVQSLGEPEGVTLMSSPTSVSVGTMTEGVFLDREQVSFLVRQEVDRLEAIRGAADNRAGAYRVPDFEDIRAHVDAVFVGVSAQFARKEDFERVALDLDSTTQEREAIKSRLGSLEELSVLEADVESIVKSYIEGHRLVDKEYLKRVLDERSARRRARAEADKSGARPKARLDDTLRSERRPSHTSRRGGVSSLFGLKSVRARPS